MKEKDSNFVSAVVYVHNAEKNVRDFVKMLIDVFEESFAHSEIICVNDCSEDGSTQAIQDCSGDAQQSLVTILNLSHFHGLEQAMTAGVDLAIGDYVYEFDSVRVDYDPAQILKIYERSLAGYGIVSTSPDKKERFSSRIFYTLFSNLAHSPRMYTESFRILSRRAVNRIKSMNKTVPYRKTVYLACGLRTDHLVYQRIKDVEHIDRMEERYRRELAVNALILFTSIGYRFSFWMTALMMCISGGMIVYSVVCYFTIQPVAGWTTTILFLSVAFLGLFGILTIVIKYLQLLVELTFKRREYSYESIEKLTE